MEGAQLLSLWAQALLLLVAPAARGAGVVPEPRVIQTQVEWRLGGDSVDPDQLFGVIDSVVLGGDGNFYILDAQLETVAVFSPGGRFLRRIGRSGEGPGEFRWPTDLLAVGDSRVGVLQTNPGAVVLLTLDGRPAGQWSLRPPGVQEPAITTAAAYHATTLVVAGQANSRRESMLRQTQFLSVVDTTGRELARLHEESREYEYGRPVIDEKRWQNFKTRWAVGPDGHIAASLDYDRYAVQLWAADGTPLRVLEGPPQAAVRTGESRRAARRVMAHFTSRAPDAEIRVAQRHRQVEAVYARAGGEIWVLPADGIADRPEGSLGIFDAFDATGRLHARWDIRGEGDPRRDKYLFVGDRVLVLGGYEDARLGMGGGEELLGGEARPMGVLCLRMVPMDDAGE